MSALRSHLRRVERAVAVARDGGDDTLTPWDRAVAGWLVSVLPGMELVEKADTDAGTYAFIGAMLAAHHNDAAEWRMWGREERADSRPPWPLAQLPADSEPVTDQPVLIDLMAEMDDAGSVDALERAIAAAEARHAAATGRQLA